MSFKQFLFEKSEKELEDELDSLDIDDFNVKDVDVEKDELDIDDDGDLDDEDLEDIKKHLKDMEDDDEELEEGVVPNAKEYMQRKFQKLSKNKILKKLAGDKVPDKMLKARFQLKYEYNKAIGKFGKWVRRKEKPKATLMQLVKLSKKKGKILKKTAKKGSTKTKSKRSSARNAVRFGGKVDKLKDMLGLGAKQ